MDFIKRWVVLALCRLRQFCYLNPIWHLPLRENHHLMMMGLFDGRSWVDLVLCCLGKFNWLNPIWLTALRETWSQRLAKSVELWKITLNGDEFPIYDDFEVVENEIYPIEVKGFYVCLAFMHNELFMDWWVLQIPQAHFQSFSIKPKIDEKNSLLFSNPRVLNFPLEKVHELGPYVFFFFFNYYYF